MVSVPRAPVVTQAQRQLRLRGRADPFFLLIGAILLTALLATLYLTANGQGTATTYRIIELQAQQAQLERQNEELQLQVSQAQSLDRVQAAATRMGMVPIDSKQVQYIELPAAFARAQPSPTPIP